MLNKTLFRVAVTATAFALFVVMLGAYTRLTDAGLGCPDWPGCYGKLVLPSAQAELREAQTAFPDIPIESRKAWTEMAHRYVAGTLGLFILFIGLATFLSPKSKQRPRTLPGFLLLLVLFQATLGMWTVTLKLLPVVVMGHLLGGILIFASLARYATQMSPLAGDDLPCWRPWLRLALVVVFVQIALGGWVSSNYAGISCLGFPQCNGMWWPQLYWQKAFDFFSSIGANYQGGLMDNELRVTIQFVHRLGAVVTLFTLLPLAIAIFVLRPSRALVVGSTIVLIGIIVQFTLGVLNVLYLLPLKVAVAHNGVAAVLLGTLSSMLYLTRRRSIHE